MRPRRPFALTLAALAVTLAPTQAVATPAAPLAAPPAAAGPRCAGAHAGRDFPVTGGIAAGPATYRAGGGPRSLSLVLTNTTTARCVNLHPVLVLVDDQRRLAPGRLRVEFHDGTRWRPASVQRTERDEIVAVFGDSANGENTGSGAFTLRPHQRRAVPVRLAFTDATAPDHVVATAALVQRRDDDGEWVGESAPYAFDIVAPGDGGVGEDEDGNGNGTEDGTGSGTEDGGGDFPHVPPLNGELAATGPSALLGLGATSAALLTGGGALVLGSRRYRAPHS